MAILAQILFLINRRTILNRKERIRINFNNNNWTWPFLNCLSSENYLITDFVLRKIEFVLNTTVKTEAVKPNIGIRNTETFYWPSWLFHVRGGYRYVVCLAILTTDLIKSNFNYMVKTVRIKLKTWTNISVIHGSS